MNINRLFFFFFLPVSSHFTNGSVCLIAALCWKVLWSHDVFLCHAVPPIRELPVGTMREDVPILMKYDAPHRQMRGM